MCTEAIGSRLGNKDALLEDYAVTHRLARGGILWGINATSSY